VDGIPPHVTPTVEEAPWTRPDAADVILKNSGAVIRAGGDRAFYSPTTDHIGLPQKWCTLNRSGTSVPQEQLWVAPKGFSSKSQ
jgi:antirestriction protein ArdC